MEPISGVPAIVAMVAKNAGIFGIVIITVAYATLAERRVSAFIQDRRGPNRVGPFGLLQPIADGIKNIIKEETGVKTRYPLEGLVNHYLEKYGLDGFEDQIEAIATEVKSKGIKEDELNHYIAYNLIYSRRYREAELVTRVMLTLFPEAGHLHMILARVYEALNRNEQALESYRKAFVYVNEKGKLDIIRDAISRSQGFK